MATFTAGFLRFPTGNEPIIELVERSDLKLELELDSLTEQESVEDSPESEVSSVVSEIDSLSVLVAGESWLAPTPTFGSSSSIGTKQPAGF